MLERISMSKEAGPVPVEEPGEGCRTGQQGLLCVSKGQGPILHPIPLQRFTKHIFRGGTRHSRFIEGEGDKEVKICNHGASALKRGPILPTYSTPWFWG